MKEHSFIYSHECGKYEKGDLICLNREEKGVTPSFFSVGIGWTFERRNWFNDNPTDFTLDSCTVRLTIDMVKPERLFTMNETGPLQPTTRRLNNFLNLAIITEPVQAWQAMHLDPLPSSPIFNLFSDHFSKVKKSLLKKKITRHGLVNTFFSKTEHFIFFSEHGIFRAFEKRSAFNVHIVLDWPILRLCRQCSR